MLNTIEKSLLFENLATKSWSSHLNFISIEECHNLRKYIDFHLQHQNFKQAEIGNGLNQKEATSIRNSDIAWINHWDARKELTQLYNSFTELQAEFNRSFYLSLKRFESQLAFYPKGGFYKKHIDQLRDTKHRQITLILYLMDCPIGGELVIYNQNDKNKIDTIIKPKAAQVVCFNSAKIFHEVLPTELKRYSITTWFRDDLIVF